MNYTLVLIEQLCKFFFINHQLRFVQYDGYWALKLTNTAKILLTRVIEGFDQE